MGKHQPRVANEDAANNKRLAVIHKMEPQGIDYTSSVTITTPRSLLP